MTLSQPRIQDTPRIFSHDETSNILDAINRTIANSPEGSEDHFNALRDRVIVELALYTALREHEIAALDVGDVFDAHGRPVSIVRLRVYKGHRRHKRPSQRQKVALPAHARDLLVRYLETRRALGHDLSACAPLFVSRLGKRIACRTIRYLFGKWQRAAGIASGRGFHALRHTACTRLGKLFPAELTRIRDFARHASERTTALYLHTTTEELAESAERLAAASRPGAAAPSDLLALAQQLAALNGVPSGRAAVPTTGPVLFHGAPSERASVLSVDALILQILSALSSFVVARGTDGTGFRG